MSNSTMHTAPEASKHHDPIPAASSAQVAPEKAVEAVAAMGKTAAKAAPEMARQAAEHGQEVLRQGMRAMAAMQAPIAEISSQGSRRFVEATAGVTNVYRAAAERTVGDLQAVGGACSQLGQGVQQYQRASLDLISRAMQGMASKHQSLLQAKSPVAFAEIQRDIYLDGLSTMFTASTTLLQFVGQMAQDAMRPLQERAETHKQA